MALANSLLITLEDCTRHPDSIINLAKEIKTEVGTQSLRRVDQKSPFGRIPGYYQAFARKNLSGKQVIDVSSERRVAQARQIIVGYFDHLERNKPGQYSSRPEDYYVTLECADRRYCYRKLFFAKLDPDTFRVPVGYLAMEPILSVKYDGQTRSSNTLGVYANLVNRNMSHLAEYVIVEACRIAVDAGYKYLALGGSELPDLVRWKRSLAGSLVPENQMYWKVFAPD